MKGYGVHLLFHVLALAVGLGIGIAGALWWLNHNNTAMWLGLASAVGGVLLLTMQGFYIAASGPAPRPRPVAAPRPRPAADPQPRSQRIDNRAAHTAIQSHPVMPPPDVNKDTDEDDEPRSPAMEALKEHQQQQG